MPVFFTPDEFEGALIITFLILAAVMLRMFFRAMRDA